MFGSSHRRSPSGVMSVCSVFCFYSSTIVYLYFENVHRFCVLFSVEFADYKYLRICCFRTDHLRSTNWGEAVQVLAALLGGRLDGDLPAAGHLPPQRQRHPGRILPLHADGFYGACRGGSWLHWHYSLCLVQDQPARFAAAAVHPLHWN